MTPDEIAELRRVVAVRPLVWSGRNSDGSIHIAKTDTLTYWAWDGCWSRGNFPGTLADGGIEGAKAAAQADYEQRILSALTLASRALPAAPDVGGDADATDIIAAFMRGPTNSESFAAVKRQVTRLCEQAKREAYAECVALIKQQMEEPEFGPDERLGARVALATAIGNIGRGRLLTEKERHNNLEKSMREALAEKKP